MTFHRLTRYVMVILLTLPALANAQPLKATGIDTLSLQDLMNIKITVASAKELTPRESPGVVSYITAEDIRQTGARDLMELLQFVPGFEFGTDVEGVVGLGIRGNWAHEGKVVLLIDGIEMNETLFSTLQFGNHYPVENIERIEIIRGPGSAMYGGFAAYAVINILTRKAYGTGETSASTHLSASTSGISRTGATVSHAFKKSKISSGLQLTYNQAERSQSSYTDVYGTTHPMHENSDLNDAYFNGYLQVGNTRLMVIGDNYTTTNRDKYIESLPQKYSLDFNSIHAALSHEISAGKTWKIVPKAVYSYQVPWLNIEDPNSGYTPFHVRTSRMSMQLNASGNISRGLNLLTGIQHFYDRSVDQIEGWTYERSGTNIFTYNNSAVYVQGLYNYKDLNFIAGMRGNFNSEFDPTLAPRAGVTYVRNKWHAKILYNKSFRSPSTQNLNLAPTIYPELTSVGELEAGFAMGKSMYVTANVYHISTTDPIVYFFDTLTNSDAYTNMEHTGSMGYEIGIQYKTRRSQTEANLSYYTPASDDLAGIYTTDNQSEFLGLAPVKVNLRHRQRIRENISACITLNYQSRKWAITSVDPESDNSKYTRIPDLLLCSVYANYNLPKAPHFTISAGINNLLNQQQWFVQPYNSNHAPIPGMGREVSIKLAYRTF